MAKKFKSFSVIVCCCVLAGCATGGGGNTRVQYQAPDTPSSIRSTGPESEDILSCADELARDLLSLPEISGATPYCRMVLRAVKNESVFRFDAETISDQLRHLLIENAKGRIRFVERSRGGDVAEFDPAVLAEREMKREGMVDRGESKALAGADFFLTGTVRSHTVVTGGGRDDTTFFFFILEDAETGELAWEHSYGPIRKVTEKGKAYR